MQTSILSLKLAHLATLTLLGGSLIPPGAPDSSSITESQFQETIARVVNIYVPTVSEKKLTLALDTDWAGPYVAAGSNLYNGQFKLLIYGGLARVKPMTTDSLALVACHEFGHLLGGAPRETLPSSEWASAEGQADYFAASKCLKRYFSSEDNLAFVATTQIAPEARQLCQKSYSDPAQAAICMRIINAGKAFTEMATIADDEPVASLSSFDPSQAETTLLNNYPSIQCRLDTFVAGALCHADPSSDVFCGPGEKGARPACWFRALN